MVNPPPSSLPAARRRAAQGPQRRNLGTPTAFAIGPSAVKAKTKAARMNSGTTAWADGLSRSCQPKPGSG